MSSIACIGCGGQFPDIVGPAHRYLDASPGCWACFGEVLAREYGDLDYNRAHRLTVDTYALQHPGRPSTQTIRSVALHAISLCAVLEEGLQPSEATKLLERAARSRERFVWLPPPPSMGPLTVADVVSATGADDHERRVHAWAQSAWTAWSAHHPRIREWLRESWAL